MQLFGLIGLLISLMLIAWLFTIWIGPMNTDDDYSVKTQLYIDAINSAEDAASQLGGQ